MVGAGIMPEAFAFSAATSDDLRRRRRLVFWLAHSLVNASKTSGDSYRVMTRMIRWVEDMKFYLWDMNCMGR